jgi:hypothetical protein
MRGVEQIPWLYDLGMAAIERAGLRRWREWLVKGATGRTLDLGTGTGRDLPLFAPGVRHRRTPSCQVEWPQPT